MIKKISLVIISVLLSLFTAEIILRAFTPSFKIMNAGIYEYDPDLGYKIKNNLDISMSYKEQQNIHVKTNQYGFRDNSGIYGNTDMKILCIGDSHTFGLGVDQDETYPAQLQRLLNQKSKTKIRIVNAGVPAYGWLEEQVMLNKVLGKVKPDIVVMQVSWNDINDNGMGIPKYLIDKKGNLIQSETKKRPGGFGQWGMKTGKLSPFQVFALKHSHLATLLINHWNKFLYSVRQEEIDSELNRRKWQVSETVIADIKNILTNKNIPLLVFIHPGIRFEKYNTRAKMIYNIEDLLTANEISYYNLYSLMKQDLPREDIYISNDEHFNSNGYRLMAAVIADKLVDNGYIHY